MNVFFDVSTYDVHNESKFCTLLLLITNILMYKTRAQLFVKELLNNTLLKKNNLVAIDIPFNDN